MDSNPAIASGALPGNTAEVVLPSGSRQRRTRKASLANRQPDRSFEADPLPGWIGRKAGDHVDAAFAAGAAVHALDMLLRSDALWLGSWRMRLCCQATIAAAQLLRIDADEASLRDALHLTRAGDDPGPAGRLHLLLRRWASRPLHLAGEIENAILSEAGSGLGGSGLAALLTADRELAERLGWKLALPLHLAVIRDPALRLGANGKSPRADEPGWETTRHAVLLKSAQWAHALAVTTARRAETLTSAANALRTRDDGRGLRLILADDSVAPWRMVGKGGLGSDRAARRLCETLHARGALRLLTDRPTFRLYGL